MLKILQICPKPPHPPVDGGSIAADNLTQGFIKQGHRVKVLAISTPKHLVKPSEKNQRYAELTKFETVFVDTGFKPLSAVSSMFSNRSYNIDRFYSRRFEQKVAETLGRSQYDFVLFESIYTAPYLKAVRSVTGIPAFLRAHNIEHHIWLGNQKLEKNRIKRAYFALLAERLGKYERDICNKFDGIFPITDEDRSYFIEMGCVRPLETIPFGIDLANIHSSCTQTYPTVFHLGAMDWRPNQDAIRWFLDEVWRVVAQQFPTVPLYLGGRGMPDWLTNYRSLNVKVVGEVENAYDFMASNSIMVVPLFSGSGMRIKMVEGMALGKTIISTALGATGIPYQNGKQLIIAENKQQFVSALTAVLSDKKLCDRLGKNAEKMATTHFNNDDHVKKLIEFFMKSKREFKPR